MKVTIDGEKLAEHIMSSIDAVSEGFLSEQTCIGKVGKTQIILTITRDADEQIDVHKEHLCVKVKP